jgi:hypothetical protein
MKTLNRTIRRSQRTAQWPLWLMTGATVFSALLLPRQLWSAPGADPIVDTARLSRPHFVTLGAQNLVVNGNFVTDLSHWTMSVPGGTMAWIPNGAQGPEGSGAVLITNPSFYGDASLVSQCVNLPADYASLNLQFAVSTLIPDPTMGSSASAMLMPSATPNCAGSGINVDVRGLPIVTDLSSGANVQGGSYTNNIAFPPGTESVLVALQVENDRGRTSEVAFSNVGLWITRRTQDCGGDSSFLCLGASQRFSVSALFNKTCKTPQGFGVADGVVITSSAGFFWCDSNDTPEVTVAIRNDCMPTLGAHAGTYQVLLGGMTNAGVTITVTDWVTGTKKTYTNPASTPFETTLDTTGIAVCP